MLMGRRLCTLCLAEYCTHNLFQPYLDRTAGSVDTWPAHAAMPFAPASQDAKSMSKPKFLQRLETFLQKELRALGCTDSTVMSEKRLQVSDFILKGVDLYDHTKVFL